MKNMVYCFLCNLLLIALIMLTSCGRHDEIMTIVPAPVYMQQEAGCFVQHLKHPWQGAYRPSAQTTRSAEASSFSFCSFSS